MKKRLKKILPILILLVGLLMISYPIVSNIYNEKINQKEDLLYSDKIENLDSTSIENELDKCKNYNENLIKEENLKDPFAEGRQESISEEYESLLNFDGDRIMGYLKIPVLETTLPIYHSTDESVLQIGVGHLEGSSLPIGGKGTHSVLSAHNGLLGRKLFADLDKLIIGDIFTINTLGEKKMYRIDNISVVLPEETAELRIVDGKDYVTLVTCTPYGENSHRLLVKGSRINHDNSLEKIDRKISSSWQKEYIDALKIAVPIFLIFVLIRTIKINKN